jgi:hypothetical protein
MHGYGQYCPLAKGAEVFATDLRTMTRVWMGEESVELARRTRQLELAGHAPQ